MVRTTASVNDWLTEPQRLDRSVGMRVLRGSIGLFGVLASIPFLVLAGVAFDRVGREVDQKDWDRIQSGMSAAVTAFPIIFAAVMGRLLKAIATWQLEKGARLGILEQLLGSSTVAGAFTTQLFLRSFNLLGLGLLLLWALSPLGGQSSLHILHTTRQANITAANITYLDSTIQPAANIGGDVETTTSQQDALYLSLLLSPASVKQSPMDLWGNVKIPLMSRLNTTANETGWRHILDSSVISYASLMGVPMEGITARGNTSFHLETSYYDLDCFDISMQQRAIPFTEDSSLNFTSLGLPGVHVAATPKGTFLGGNGSLSCPMGCSLSFKLGLDRYISTGISANLMAFPNITGNEQTYFPDPPIFMFQSRWWGGPGITSFTTAYCHLYQIYVETAVTCVSDGASTPQCAVTAMRDSLRPHPAKDVTFFLSALIMQNFADRLVAGSSRGHAATSSLTERYMNNTANPMLADVRGDLPLFQLPPRTFSERLSQVINTYYLAGLQPFGTTGNLSAGAEIGPRYAPLSATGLRSVWNPTRYQINAGWMFMFLLATITMLVAAIACGILIDRTIVPDILGAVSSMTRDSTREPFPHGGSTLDGLDRARLLKEVSVRLGEVRDDSSSTRYLTFTGSEFSTRAQRERLYE
ncbi:hypothetical protein BDV38DRAFT_269678 [Aspergillus pseudotamarii]|uniref:Uncharacterized protein n=1 Tax=Aspergillus pseudotamarii TaxID=132259 RepID=A0A5N6T0X0_ASPPS|nr:uncharacterized protein BDV38DRAFT_269678 [Aspergillus pseudotamarii]KAE8139910.1 hypothetical protein BDV38DRAFT_269678 [Aspergillus pseudotamarii]